MGRNGFFILLPLIVLAACSESPPTFRPVQTLPAPLQPSQTLTERAESSFPLDFSEPQWQQTGEVQWVAYSKTIQSYLDPGRPYFLGKNYVFDLKPGQSLVAWLSDEVFEKSQAKINLKEVGPALSWGSGEAKPESRPYYPGKWLRVENAAARAYVTVLPFQIETETSQVFWLRSARLNLAWRNAAVKKVATAESYLVAPRALARGAEKIRQMQLRIAGVETEILWAEDFDKGPIAEWEEYPSGFRDPEAFQSIVDSSYRFQRARRLKAFFDQRLYPGSALRYVTLLGSSREVPPSYYFSVKERFGLDFGVTDQCYVSRRQCREPHASVGRLPFTSEFEVDRYLEKLTRWSESSPRSELALFGGKAFPHSELFLGEFTTLELLRTPDADWRQVQKFFRTDSRFNVQFLGRLIRGEIDTELAYFADHGDGNRWYLDGETFSAKTILDARAMKEGTVPFIVSSACSNAAFDGELTREVILPEPETFGDFSVGEALLRSEAGAIGYWGVSRLGYGSTEFVVDRNGNVNSMGSTLNIQILHRFFENYRRRGHGRVGDLIRESLEAFAFTNGVELTDPFQSRAYWVMALLGDPTLPLPARREGESGYPEAQMVSLPIEPEKSSDPPSLKWDKEKGPLQLKNLHTTYRVQWFHREGELSEYKEVGQVNGVSEKLAFPELIPGSYLLRLENESGLAREHQVLFKVKN